MTTPIKQDWERLNGDRMNILTRTEDYAGFTLPVVFPKVGYVQNSEELQTDYQSVGAQAVNSLSNKLVLTLFAPSRPFMRYKLPPQDLADLLAKLGITEPDLDAKLSVSEKAAIDLLDQLQTRPKIYEIIRNLIITGNAMLELGADKNIPFQVHGLRDYVVKRSKTGRMIRAIIKEELKFDELEHEVQEILKEAKPVDYAEIDGKPKEVCYYTDIRYERDKRYYVTCYVDDTELPADYGGKYTDDDLPYRALTWELIGKNHYGTGLVEQNAGDFAALSTLSEAELRGAVMASEFRWLVNPGGQTQPEDLEQSANGAAIAGSKDDVIPISAAGAGVAQGLQIVEQINAKYVNRIGRVFLMGSSVVRDAERVTAEEVRLLAQELEANLGGVYSRLAVDFQLPVAFWLTKQLGVDISGTKIKPTIITGLDALSRNADLQNLKMCITDLVQLDQLLQGPLGVELNAGALAAAVFAGYGIDATQYRNTQDQKAALLAQRQEAALQQAAAGPVAGNMTRPQGR